MIDSSLTDIQISKIDSLSEFEKLKNEWKELYTRDQESNLFMSWEWLHCLFTASEVKWFILAFYQSVTKKYIAFAQFIVEDKYLKKLINWRLLRLGAFPLGNYSGILCDNEFEEPVVDLLSNYLHKNLSWDKLFLTHVIDSRISILLNYFSSKKFKVEINPRSVATRIVLPNSWEAYLKETIGKQTRKTFVRLLNRVNENKNLKISNLTIETLDRDVEILFKLWLDKWGEKPNSETEKKIFKELFKHNMAELNILWEKDTPIAAQGLIHDPVNSTIYAYVTGYNTDFSKLSPGNMIGLYSIKRSIKSGYKYYDFYQGEDKYKLNFGAERRYPTTAKITNKRLKTKMINSLIQLTKKW